MCELLSDHNVTTSRGVEALSPTCTHPAVTTQRRPENYVDDFREGEGVGRCDGTGARSKLVPDVRPGLVCVGRDVCRRVERILGKQSVQITGDELKRLLEGFEEVLVDVGTGDGRYARRVAQRHPRRFVIGIDAARENLREMSRKAPANALFLIANALTLPLDLAGVATQVTVNFPWGSLLAGLLNAETSLLEGLRAISRPGAVVEVRLNSGALAEEGWTLEAGTERVRDVLRRAGFQVEEATWLDAEALRSWPSSWARRLASGPDPRGSHVRARHTSGPGAP